jgi:hypothetical protein
MTVPARSARGRAGNRQRRMEALGETMIDPDWGTPPWYKRHPIYHKPEEFTGKEASELIESVRKDLAHARGKLYDIGQAHPHSKHELDYCQGALTTLLVALAYAIEQVRSRTPPKEQDENDNKSS